MNLSERTKLTLVKVAQVTGTSVINSDSVDMRGFLNCLFFVDIAIANAGNFVKIQTSSDNSAWNDLLGTKVVVAVNGDTVGIDVIRNRERYLRLVIDRSGITTITGSAFALQYEAKIMPTVQPTTVVLERHVSPAEGTA